MFGRGKGAVNLKDDLQSTIAAVAVFGAAAPRLSRFGWRLLGSRCLHCGDRRGSVPLDLCAACLGALPWQPEPLAAGAFAPFEYRDPVARDLRALKFDGDLRPAAIYGTLMAATIARRLPPENLPALLIPVPLHPSRRAERGFNQAARIARELGRRLRIPVRDDLVQRTRATSPQTDLPADRRRANVAGAFTLDQERWRISGMIGVPASGDGSIGDRAVALVDDVLTTGATLAAAEQALREIGVANVQRWAVARTMPTNTTRPTD